jgi:hypothetical protein
MTELYEFQKFDKIPRFRRDIIITEKIDGTNAQIAIIDLKEESDKLGISPGHYMDRINAYSLPYMAIGQEQIMLAGSRKRWLTDNKQGDNYGFGRWVSDNREELSVLGPGRHYGEWWGAGIQRRYGLTDNDKRFSLFNTARWGDHNPNPSCTSVVPILNTGPMAGLTVELALAELKMHGSTAAPGFMNPEGIVIYMTQARRLFKITLENDGMPKSKLKKEVDVKTSEEWQREFKDLTIIDPDGWDRLNYEYSFNEELITRGEFRYRANRSTCEGIVKCD